jgi:hypothetical protein
MVVGSSTPGLLRRRKKKKPLVPIDEDARWAPEPIRTLRRRLEFSCPYQELNHNSHVVQPSHYTNNAKPAPKLASLIRKYDNLQYK